jgi:hypothetical protein
MNVKEKASLLVLRYMSKVVNIHLAKECAIIAVDEIMTVIDWEIEYWQEVKQEIQKL